MDSVRVPKRFKVKLLSRAVRGTVVFDHEGETVDELVLQIADTRFFYKPANFIFPVAELRRNAFTFRIPLMLLPSGGRAYFRVASRHVIGGLVESQSYFVKSTPTFVVTPSKDPSKSSSVAVAVGVPLRGALRGPISARYQFETELFPQINVSQERFSQLTVDTENMLMHFHILPALKGSDEMDATEATMALEKLVKSKLDTDMYVEVENKCDDGSFRAECTSKDETYFHKNWVAITGAACGVALLAFAAIIARRRRGSDGKPLLEFSLLDGQDNAEAYA